MLHNFDGEGTRDIIKKGCTPPGPRVAFFIRAGSAGRELKECHQLDSGRCNFNKCFCLGNPLRASTALAHCASPGQNGSAFRIILLHELLLNNISRSKFTIRIQQRVYIIVIMARHNS